VGKLKFNKPRGLKKLTPPDRELCQLLASLGAVFNTAQLIKHEYIASALKDYIGIDPYPLPDFTYASFCWLYIV